MGEKQLIKVTETTGLNQTDSFQVNLVYVSFGRVGLDSVDMDTGKVMTA